MRKIAGFVMFAVLLCGFAAAQMQPKVFTVPNSELAFGYAYERHSGIGLGGFDIAFSHYLGILHDKVGFTADVAHVTNNSFNVNGDGYTSTTFMAGPTYRLPRYGFFSPSVHALGGVDRETLKLNTTAGTVSFEDTDYAILAGGTLDGNLSRHLAVRLAQVDYLFTHHGTTGQSSFRYTGGLVLRF